MTRPLDTISWYFLEESVPRGGGANVVNVILVDFRGYDTFGELTVLAIAALGATALMTGLHLASPAGAPPAGTPLLLRVAARWLLPARAPRVDLPVRARTQCPGRRVRGRAGHCRGVADAAHGGGGARLRLDYARIAGVGLLVAGATGIGAWLFGKPFLTSAHAEPVLPLIGQLPLASAMFFDLGVYLAVVGATMLTLVAEADATRR